MADLAISRRQVRAKAMVALSVLLIGSILVWAGFRLSASDRVPSHTHPPLAADTITRIDVGGVAIRRPIAAYHAFWSIVEKGDGGTLDLVRIDARTLRPASVTTPARPEVVAAGFGSIWVGASGGNVFRVDPATLRVTGSARVAGSIFPIAAGEGAVWVGALRGSMPSLYRIDPGTLDVSKAVASLDTKGRPCSIRNLATGADAAWTTCGNGTLHRIDVGTLSTRILPLTGLLLAVDDSALWIESSTPGLRSIDRVDSATDAVVASIPGSGFPEAAVAVGSVWLGVIPSLGENEGMVVVSRIDPGTNAIDPDHVALPVGLAGDGKYHDLYGSGPPLVGIAVGEGAVWIANPEAFQIIRIDLRVGSAGR